MPAEVIAFRNQYLASIGFTTKEIETKMEQESYDPQAYTRMVYIRNKLPMNILASEGTQRFYVYANVVTPFNLVNGPVSVIHLAGKPCVVQQGKLYTVGLALV